MYELIVVLVLILIVVCLVKVRKEGIDFIPTIDKSALTTTIQIPFSGTPRKFTTINENNEVVNINETLQPDGWLYYADVAPLHPELFYKLNSATLAAMKNECTANPACKVFTSDGQGSSIKSSFVSWKNKKGSGIYVK